MSKKGASTLVSFVFLIVIVGVMGLIFYYYFPTHEVTIIQDDNDQQYNYSKCLGWYANGESHSFSETELAEACRNDDICKYGYVNSTGTYVYVFEYSNETYESIMDSLDKFQNTTYIKYVTVTVDKKIGDIYVEFPCAEWTKVERVKLKEVEE